MVMHTSMHVGMLNHGVLDLHAPVPGLRSRPLLATTVTWLLRVCMLDVVFDDNFELQQPYLRGGAALQDRFRTAAALSALLSPFILLFLLMHFLLKHLERIYHHPSSLGAPATPHTSPTLVSANASMHVAFLQLGFRSHGASVRVHLRFCQKQTGCS